MSALGRRQWRLLANERLADLRALHAGQRWSGVYHMAGLTVECGLKAIVAKRFKRDQWPEKDLGSKIYQHKASLLIQYLPDFAKTDLESERLSNSLHLLYAGSKFWAWMSNLGIKITERQKRTASILRLHSLGTA